MATLSPDRHVATSHASKPERFNRRFWTLASAKSRTVPEPLAGPTPRCLLVYTQDFKLRMESPNLYSLKQREKQKENHNHLSMTRTDMYKCVSQAKWESRERAANLNPTAIRRLCLEWHCQWNALLQHSSQGLHTDWRCRFCCTGAHFRFPAPRCSMYISRYCNRH